MSNSTTVVDQVNSSLGLTAEKAQKVIKRNALLSTATGLIPLDSVNVAANAVIQINMIRQLSDLYHQEFDANLTKVIVTSFVGAIGGKLTSYGINQAFSPFGAFGSFGEALGNAAVSGFLTALMGEVYFAHFEEGGTLDNIKLNNFIDYVSKQIDSGELSLGSFTNPKSAFSFLSK